MSPLQTDCVNVNYYIPEDEVSDQFSEQRWERLRKYGNGPVFLKKTKKKNEKTLENSTICQVDVH